MTNSGTGIAMAGRGTQNVGLNGYSSATYGIHAETHSGISAVVTPTGPCNGLYAASYSPNHLEVREQGGGRSDVTFDFVVYGTRKGHEGFEPVTDNPRIVEALKGGGAPKPPPEARGR